MTRPRPRRARFLEAARQDVERLHADDPDLARQALQRVRDLELRRVEGQPLHAMAKAGDLSDCYKLYFGPGAPPSHRIVYRIESETGAIEILEVFAVEAREAMYAYLLAAVRLGRLPTETRPEYHRTHQRVVTRRSQRRR